LDFVRAQARIRWVLFENKKRLACVPLLLRGQLSEASPERVSRAEPIFHLLPGYGSFSAVSKSTNRPASTSAIPCLKDSGIQVFHDKFRDLRPLARGKGFELRDNFRGAHDDQNTVSS
jgi:hypothetical protein